MVTIELGGRLLDGRDHSFPGGLSSGYRGARAGSREAGTASFELFFRDGYRDGNLWFAEGATVIIRADDVVWFRGIVTGLDIPDDVGYTVGVECVEDAGRLTAARSGMTLLGVLANPAGYCWAVAPQGFPAGNDDLDRVQSIRAEILRPGEFFANEAQANARGYRKRELFDTRYYVRGVGGDGEPLVRPGLLTSEQPVERIAQRVRGAAEIGGTTLTGVDADVPGSKATVLEVILDENGDKIWPEWDEANGRYRTWGMFTRDLISPVRRSGGDSGTVRVTLFWREVDVLEDGTHYPRIELYQLLNRSVARKLGGFTAYNWYKTSGRISDADTLDGWGLGVPVHAFEGTLRHGPYGVHDDFGFTLNSSKVAWFFMGQKTLYEADEDKTYYWRQATIYEVDLEQVGDAQQEVLAFQRYFVRAASFSPTVTSDWVVAPQSSQQYSLTSQRRALFEWTSVRSGGMYQITREHGALGPVYWNGKLHLTEMACEFENTSVADVLHNAGLASDSEWWVDGNGVLCFRAVADTRGTKTVLPKKLLNARTTRRLAEAGQSDDVSGLALSERYGILLRQENNRRLLSGTLRRTVEMLPRDYSFELGSDVLVNGQSVGKLVRKMLDYPVVTLECE